jgi:Tfp pilus assembly protein PilO
MEPFARVVYRVHDMDGGAGLQSNDTAGMNIQKIAKWSGWPLVLSFVVGGLACLFLFSGPTPRDVKAAEERGRSEEKIRNLEEDKRERDLQISALKAGKVERKENVADLERQDAALQELSKATKVIRAINEATLKNIDARYRIISLSELEREYSSYGQ